MARPKRLRETPEELEALFRQIRDEGVVRNKAVYLAIGITREGTKDVLGLWIEQTEGAAFWLRIMTELKSRSFRRRRSTPARSTWYAAA